MTTPRPARWKNAFRNPAVQRLGSVVGIVAQVWFGLASVGMFLTERFPVLQPFVMWTFRLYVGSIACTIIGFMVIAPGVYLAGEFLDYFQFSTLSPLEAKLTTVWCVGAGVLFSAVLASAVVLICLGMIDDVKLWFLSLCWMALVTPWVVIGLVGRRMYRADVKSRGNPGVAKR